MRRSASFPPPLSDDAPSTDCFSTKSHPAVAAAQPRSTHPPPLPSTPPQNEDPKFAQIMRIKNNKQRLRKFTDACKTKTICPST